MTTRGSLTQHGWLAPLAIGAVLIAAFYALPVGSIEQSAVYDAAGLLAVAFALGGVIIHRPRGRAPWLAMIAGQLAFVVGDVLWTIYAALGADPFPSIADVAYLAGYPLLALGLGVAIQRRMSGGDRAGLIDGAILAIGAGIVWWAMILRPVVETGDPSPLAFWIALAYPLGDLLLIGMALALAATPGSTGRAFRLLFTSLVVVLAADLVFGLQSAAGTYVDGGTLDGAWLAGYFLFAASATNPGMARMVQARPVPVSLVGPIRLVLLGLAMLIGPALLLVERSTSDAVVIVVSVASAGLSVLVLGRLATLVGHLGRDIRRREALEERLAFQAFHDPLTGLANRRRFIAAVAAALATPQPTAVLFVDLDDFKLVNDGGGHDAGDALLLRIGERLRATVRSDDVVGRLGGDEFAVLMRSADAATAETVAARVVAALGERTEVGDATLAVSASVGLATRGEDEPLDVDELIRRADVAMYRAKAQGKNRWTTYTDAVLQPGQAPASAAATQRRQPAVQRSTAPAT
jgi:diguanylate cyclase (GGDEF)-like protein